MSRPEFKKVILFDGVCILCGSAVNFITNRERRDFFRFVPLQSEVGKRLTELSGISGYDVSSLVLIEENRIFTKSSAALRIAKELSGVYRLLYWLRIIPRPFRDAVYDFVARNRYRWFGKRTSCMIPGPELQSRFLA